MWETMKYLSSFCLLCRANVGYFTSCGEALLHLTLRFVSTRQTFNYFSIKNIFFYFLLCWENRNQILRAFASNLMTNPANKSTWSTILKLDCVPFSFSSSVWFSLALSPYIPTLTKPFAVHHFSVVLN